LAHGTTAEANVLINDLFHVAIKSPNLAATRKFYVDVLGMREADRPALDFPGIWLAASTPAGIATIHVDGGEAALDADGSTTFGTGAIDHVALTAFGFDGIRERVRAHNLPWRENVLPDIGLWQLFVYDPSGVLLELSFSAAAETIEPPVVAANMQYKPREKFFDPEDYRSFYG
jgi:catechol 2,3-dioxygenase-like lactoylglutathione lyase family enzyme